MSKIPNFYMSQRGQGMVGFIVAATFFVIPAALGINYLARLGDAKHKSHEAARYATWERTVWHQSDSRYNRKSDIDISREINQRIFAEQNRPLDSVQDRRRVAANTIQYDRNLYNWDLTNGPRAPIIETPNRRGAEPNTLAIADSRAPGTFSSAVNNVASGVFDFDRNGFYNSRISMQFHKDRHYTAEFDAALGGSNTPLMATTNNAMLVGSWNANGPGDVRRRVSRILPTDFLDNGVVDAFRGAASFAGFREFRQLDFGRVDPERVPCQRLQGIRGRGRGC
ncbi:hypothetical protein [Agarilytica rhodophyticola]|uniref:hypothetical protein n=1 Tax=Agarilytica rhodophyticola TaxID=1737490 RepID=UPI000B347361|nr:hypothetical protein [Agarilytica rhodophyticola]